MQIQHEWRDEYRCMFVIVQRCIFKSKGQDETDGDHQVHGEDVSSKSEC